MDGTPDFQLFEVLDFFAFPRSDVMPGGFDDMTAILRSVAVVDREAEFGTTSVFAFLDVDIPNALISVL